MPYNPTPKVSGNTLSAANDWNPLISETVLLRTDLGAKTDKSYVDGQVAQAKDLSNATGTLSADKLTAGTTNKLVTAADLNKLAGIQDQATKNLTDTQLTQAAKDAVGQTIASGTPGATYQNGVITVPAGTGGGSTTAPNIAVAQDPTNPLALIISTV